MIKLTSPRSQQWLLTGDFKQWRSVERKISEHPFNHAVELVIPGNVQLPPTLLPSTHPHYYTCHLPLSHFIQPDIMRKYLRDGFLVALSLGTNVDSDNVFAVLPSGKLILSVDKDTYEQFGLQGRPLRFQKHNRFLTEVDLTASQFKPERPNYERVKWSLNNILGGDREFVISWSPHQVSANESPLLQDLRAHKHQCMTDTELLHNFPMPTISGEYPHGHYDNDTVVCCSAAEFNTWLGANACGMDLSEGSPGAYVSTLTPPKPHSICQYGTRTRWTGMITSQWICTLLENAKQYLAISTGPPWVAVSVWGFDDSPLSWADCEHGWYLSGDNNYTMILFATKHFWFTSSLGTHDVVHQ